MANVARPNQKQFNEAIQALCQAGAVTRLISALIEADEYDKEFYSFHIGEALHLVSDVLSDSYCTITNAQLDVIAADKQP